MIFVMTRQKKKIKNNPKKVKKQDCVTSLLNVLMYHAHQKLNDFSKLF